MSEENRSFVDPDANPPSFATSEEAEEAFKAWNTAWKKDNDPRVTDQETQDLYKEARISARAIEDSSEFQNAEPTEIHTVIANAVDEKFSGKMSGQKKADLKREHAALLFNTVHARKKAKYEVEYNRRFGEYHTLKVSELEKKNKDLKTANVKLDADNQTLSHSTHLAKDRVKTKNQDLSFQALNTAALVYANERKVAFKLFHNKGFAISSKILTKSSKVIKDAKDFGPRQKVAGKPFFKGLFSELSKGPGEKKMPGMTDVKNYELIYSDKIDKTVANDKKSVYTGHPLDTQENRNLIWYGSEKHNTNGIACAIIKNFNSHRSDAMSKTLRPAIGTLTSN